MDYFTFGTPIGADIHLATQPRCDEALPGESRRAFGCAAPPVCCFPVRRRGDLCGRRGPRAAFQAGTLAPTDGPDAGNGHDQRLVRQPYCVILCWVVVMEAATA